jgi:hypothetical protein
MSSSARDRENRVLRPLVSETTEPMPLGSQISLFDHAMRLHQKTQDSPLPRDGEPYPDEEFRRRGRPGPPHDGRMWGADVAEVLDAYFADPGAAPDTLVTAFRDVFVPIHRSDHVAAAARRADKHRVKQTGRWLVRHSPDSDSAIVGLALLATISDEDDIPLIQTIGLLSDKFAALAAEALRRRPGGAAALLWLAPRVSGWGRVYIVEALCQRGVGPEARAWLLRFACEGGGLDGYFAGKVATAAHLHEGIISPAADDDLIDHTGRLLLTMADCAGMGLTLERYPHAPIVLSRHAELLKGQTPTVARYLTATVLTYHLTKHEPHRLGCTVGQRARVLADYLAVLNRPEWIEAVRSGFNSDNGYHSRIARDVAPNLPLAGFPTPKADHNERGHRPGREHGNEGRP